MERIDDWDAYRKRVGTVRRLTPAYSSNVYISPEQVERWCADGRLKAITTDKAVLFLLSDRDFFHIYHVAEDQAALAAALASLPVGLYTADLVGQGCAVEQLCGIYAGAGFEQRAFLSRMSLTQPPVARIENGADFVAPEVASAADAPQVAALLDRLLDRFTEQLPDLAELERAAETGRLLLVRRSGEIAGMLMYDLRGQLAHLRYWHVDNDAQGQGIGRQLMAEFLSRCEQARRIILWVIGDNKRSIAIYRHYGFAEDGLLDRIMILRKESL
jgi:ribosomal protein S18 acetylase RimI-like enzyme